MSAGQVHDLVAKGEGLTIEFKEGLSSSKPESICKEIAALATMQGGDLLIGVCDDGIICGVADAKRVLERVTSWIGDYLDPVPHIHGEVVVLDSISVVHFIVRSSVPSVFFYKGTPYLRVGSSSRPANAAQTAALILSGQIADEIRKRSAQLIAVHNDLDPARHVAAGITGQGELATMNYADLLARLRKDLPLAGFVSRPSTACS